MNGYPYYHPIEVRYGDIDAQGHVNNAVYLTYMEQARIGYLRHLGLWDGASFFDTGIILAEATVSFLRPIRLTQPVEVGVRVNHLGNKSFTMEYVLEDAHTREPLARGRSVLVTYDYRQGRSIPIPPTWRETLRPPEPPPAA